MPEEIQDIGVGLSSSLSFSFDMKVWKNHNITNLVFSQEVLFLQIHDLSWAV